MYQSNNNNPSSFKPSASFPKMSIGGPGGLLRNKWVLIGLGVLVAGLIVWFIYSYIDTRNQLDKLAKNPNSVQQTESNELTKAIGQYLELPNETPTIATVNNADKLKDQEFFRNAQNGDKVLIYSKAGRALLYRPSTKKVIEYSKIDLNNTPTTNK